MIQYYCYYCIDLGHYGPIILGEEKKCGCYDIYARFKHLDPRAIT